MTAVPGTRRRRAVVAASFLTAALGFAADRPAAAAAAASASSSATAMLSWWKAAVLGVVEGVTEFLPVSSTGHLLVTARLLGLPDAKGSAGLDAVNTYVVAIQFGAILAVAGLFWRRFRSMFRGLIGRDDEGRRLLIVLVVAFLPAATLGVLLDKKIEDGLFGPWPVIAAWVAGGVLILVLERAGRIPSRGVEPAVGTDPLLSISTRQALVIGLAQCVALWPGTSRSLATIVGALLVGVAMPAAVEFSFLLGFATLGAATAFKLAKDGGTLVDTFGVVDPLIGAVFAFGAAALSIKWLVAYLQRHDLTLFAWYRFAVAAIAVGLIAAGTL